MFDRFSLPDLARVSRRTMLAALVVGVVGLAACLYFNEPWGGLGLCAGLATGMSNFRMIQRSVRKVGERMPDNKRRPLALNTMGRMAVITVVAFALVFVLPPLGFGLIGGMALFQMVLLANVTRSMLRMTAAPIAEDAVADGEVAADPPAVEVPGDGRGVA